MASYLDINLDIEGEGDDKEYKSPDGLGEELYNYYTSDRIYRILLEVGSECDQKTAFFNTGCLPPCISEHYDEIRKAKQIRKKKRKALDFLGQSDEPVSKKEIADAAGCSKRSVSNLVSD